MNLNEYQVRAYSTAIYPPQYKVVYPVLKLMGELGELDQADGDQNDGYEAIIKEAGDVFWYLAALCTDLGYQLQYIIPTSITDTDCFNSALIAGTEICETVGKKIRDGEISEERQNYIAFLLRTIAAGVLVYVEYFDISLDEILEKNLKKLQLRAEQGKLTGDGDDRECEN